MKTIIVATQNIGKVKEIKSILADLPVEVKTMGEVGIDIDIEENGLTFEDNAKIKSEAIANMIPDAIVLADDSGLEIDCLNKEPGVHSARYLGKDTSYDIKNQVILDNLKDVPKEKRSARFVCAIAMSMKDRETIVTRATLEGSIGYEIKGENGFGYDPIFFIDELGTYSAVLSLEDKNKVSHRAKALQNMKKEILKFM